MVMKPETVQAVRAFQTGFALMKTVLKMWRYHKFLSLLL
jgi:hypothetical protein